MFDADKLRGKMAERRVSVSQLAEALGISASTLYRKLQKGGKDITLGDADGIRDTLRLSAYEAKNIFFAPNVARGANFVPDDDPGDARGDQL